jgi:hypothetical protein
VRIYVGKDPLHPFSQKQKSRCHDVLQTPQIEKRDDATSKYVTWMPMHYVEACYGDQQL